MTKRILTIAELTMIVGYDKDTGALTWLKQTASCVKVGTTITSTDNGYIRFNVYGKTYRGHRLAWALVKGAWPAAQIDHRNGKRADNRWENLREATRAINLQNQRGPRRDNKLGMLGVCPYGKRFRAQITVNGENIRLGTFSTPEAASEAYLTAKREKHPGCTI